MKLLFLLRGKREEFVQGGAEGVCEAGWDGIGPREDKDTPGAEGGVDLGDCGERIRRGEGIRGEERGAVNNRNLAHSSRWRFVSMKKGLKPGTCLILCMSYVSYPELVTY